MTYKLLIVDDELANLRLLERLFARDFECLTASSGAEAIRLLEQHDVAILITDQRMPQMTGIDLLKHTARLRPHMVRILLTGYTDVEVLVDAINSGLVYMYVTKPWNNDDLKLKVKLACEHYETNKKSSSLALANDRLLGGLQQVKLSVVTALGEMLRTRDEYAFGHALRVRDHAIAIAETMGVSAEIGRATFLQSPRRAGAGRLLTRMQAGERIQNVRRGCWRQFRTWERSSTLSSLIARTLTAPVPPLDWRQSKFPSLAEFCAWPTSTI